MGKMIERIAGSRGHQVVARVDASSDIPPFGDMEVAIDFSHPGAAADNVRQCLLEGVPVVSGTTGWLDRYEEVSGLCHEVGGAFLYASNFSLGMNLFFELNAHLARLMSGVSGYEAGITEIHHTRKLDAPSGTAISLAGDIVANSRYTGWDTGGETPEGILPIVSVREGDVPGTHEVYYDSQVDRIEIRHVAHNREGFALGALLAAEWLPGKQGVFGMKDVLNLR